MIRTSEDIRVQMGTYDEGKCEMIVLIPIKRASWCSKEAGQVKPGTQHLHSFRLSTPVPLALYHLLLIFLLRSIISIQCQFSPENAPSDCALFNHWCMGRRILSSKCSWRKNLSVFSKNLFGELNSIRRIHSSQHQSQHQKHVWLLKFNWFYKNPIWNKKTLVDGR